MPGSPVLDIGKTFGAAFVGLLVSTTLLGVTIVQTWIYFWKDQNRDPKRFKFFILFVTVMDAIHTMLCTYAIYWYLVLNFGNVENLGHTVWAMNLQVVFSMIVSASVQLFYARRIYKLSQSIIFPILIVASLAFGVGFGLYFTVRALSAKGSTRVHSTRWRTYLAMFSGVLADILIATAMCWSLYRKRTGFARTDTIIMTLMAYTLNSGLLTSLLGIAMAASFIASPASMIWVPFMWAISKCYVNSFLAMLNSRDYVRDRTTTDNLETAYNLSSIRIEPPSDSEAYGSKSRQPGISVSMHRSITSDFQRSKSDHDVEPTFEITKSEASITIPL